MLSSSSAEKLRTKLLSKKLSANFSAPTPNPFRTMPKETPHRQTSPPARGGYSAYNDRASYDRGRGGYSRGGGGGGRGGQSAYNGRGQAYQSGYGGYRGRGGSRGGYPPPSMGMPPQPVGVGMNMPFGMSFFFGFQVDLTRWIRARVQSGVLPESGVAAGWDGNELWSSTYDDELRS